MDKQGVYNIGKTRITVHKRVAGLQTACVDDIDIILEYKTSDATLLERITRNILDNYHCKSEREHFRVNLDFVRGTIQLIGGLIHTLLLAYHTINTKEFDTTIEYVEDSNPALMWFKECTVPDVDAKFHLSEAFPRFLEWHNCSQGVTYRG
ncbi:hypothetical protein BDR26DRAFT_941609 [Obelidium mucronatum]|nr:hypothetical protein BDR26DRAFT_941609 [Obelidium mucronatum]